MFEEKRKGWRVGSLYRGGGGRNPRDHDVFNNLKWESPESHHGLPTIRELRTSQTDESSNCRSGDRVALNCSREGTIGS